MGLNIFKRTNMEDEMREPKEEYIEVNVMDGTGIKKGSIGIKVEKLNEFADTEKILKSVREGEIVFLKIKGLKEKDIGELKRAVDKLKKTIVANNGDIAGIEQDWLILTPQFATVRRD
jgi:SepF-like predicted cell division protein (DUF552 family)